MMPLINRFCSLMSYISRRLWITRWGSLDGADIRLLFDFFVCFCSVLLSCFTSLLCSKGAGFTINNTYLCPLVCHLPFSVHTNTYTAETHDEECVVVFTGCKVIFVSKCFFLSGTFILAFLCLNGCVFEGQQPSLPRKANGTPTNHLTNGDHPQNRNNAESIAMV